MHRYLAVWLPFLPADRILRQAGWKGSQDEPREPLVLVEKVKGALRLAAVSREALKTGLEPGLTLADARARIPGMIVVDLDPGADARLLAQIADDCERFSPSTMIDGADGLILDITGCGHLFGGEAQLKRALCLRFRRFGFHVRAALAPTPDMARALARYGQRRRGVTLEEAVRALPIAALRAPEAVRLALSRAGLKTIGDLADRPSLPLAARFGEELTLTLRRVLGLADAPISPRRPAPVCLAERRFPEPIARAEDIEAVLVELAEETARLLAQRREGGRLFEASFFRADGAVRRLGVETGRPMRDPWALLRLFRERLDVLADPLDPGFGFDLIRLAVPEAEPLAAAQTSLDGRVVEDDEIAGLIERLSTRFGRDHVLRFIANDTHDPERAAQPVPALDATPGAAWPAIDSDEPPLRPLQLLDPPQPISTTAEVPDGPPRRFNWRRVDHDIVHAEGPERIAAEWWRRPAATRDYYRVEDAEGRRFWLFRSGLYGGEQAPRWYVHGVFA